MKSLLTIMKKRDCKEVVPPVFRYYAVRVKGCMKRQLKCEALIFMYIFPKTNMFRTNGFMFIDTMLFLFVLHGTNGDDRGSNSDISPHHCHEFWKKSKLRKKKKRICTKY